MLLGFDFSTHTYIYDWTIEKWSELPEMPSGGLMKLACAPFTYEGRLKIALIGGLNNNSPQINNESISKMNVLDFDSQKWSQGPDDIAGGKYCHVVS
jgi:hypothetical protein